MKQMEKLGSQGSRMLSDDQMKGITGGKLVPLPRCTPDIPGATCSTFASCSVTDSKGNVHYGACDARCFCNLFADPGGPIIIPDLP